MEICDFFAPYLLDNIYPHRYGLIYDCHSNSIFVYKILNA